jgi:hypothetical protein
MHFIEHWFHLAPDHGSGATEAMFITVAAVLLGTIVSCCLKIGRARRPAGARRPEQPPSPRNLLR